jgi:DNA-binding transcriptional regulator YhcF (GntR family)
MTASTPSSAEDIAELFRGAIRSGQLGDGERLPTVRQTARDFAVAQATAAKAYKALEQSGFVVTRTAAGTRVAPGASPAPHSVIEHVRTLVEASTDAQVSLEDVIAILRAIWVPERLPPTDSHQDVEQARPLTGTAQSESDADVAAAVLANPSERGHPRAGQLPRLAP